jgi:Na+-driven multidrug efflux pump
MSTLVGKGWELGLQRFSEWGNLAIITALIGAISSESLAETSPTIQYITIIALGMQGLAQGSGMLIKRNTATIEQSLKENKTDLSISTYQENRKVLIRNNVLGLVVSSACVVSFYVFREPLCDMFLNADADQETRTEAQKVLWISMLGVLADAPRTICLGALRGWREVLYPTLSSLFMMTAIGVPVAYGLTTIWQDVDETFFTIRDLTMLVAALLAAKQCQYQLKKQKEKIDTTVGRPHLLAQPPNQQPPMPVAQQEDQQPGCFSRLFRRCGFC